MLRCLALLSLAVGVLGCDAWPVRKSSAGESALAASAGAPASKAAEGTPTSVARESLAPASIPERAISSAAVAREASVNEACSARIVSALAEVAVPGVPAYEARRLQFARVRGRSSLFRRPLAEPSEALTEAVTSRGRRTSIVEAVRRLERALDNPAKRREVFLREGYLFAEDPELALALVEQLQLARLFEEPTIYLQRGVEIFELERAEGRRKGSARYLHRDGPFATMPAELLHGDRVASSRAELQAGAVAVDLRDLVDNGAFDRVRPVHFSERRLVADLRYGASPELWVRALIELDGAKATVACEDVTSEQERARSGYLAERTLLKAAFDRLRGAVREMIREELPFDAAPDQANGVLRSDWRTAYLQGKLDFSSGGRRYPVYTPEGKARPPEVCIDFLTDIWERASGTWYQPAEQKEAQGKRTRLEPAPKLVEGALNFDRMKIRNRRSVVQFERFAKRNDELFDVWNPSKTERVKFGDRQAFFEWMRERSDMFRLGDMLFIHGVKEGGRPHDHSLLVTEVDPILGVVTLVASNAVKPREQTLEGILHISPGRTLRSRIRVKAPWLELLARNSGTSR